MPSYSLANWDGHLSQQNQQNEDNPPTGTPLSFGPPIGLLNPSKPKSLQEGTQHSAHTDDIVNQRVGSGGGEEGSLGVSSSEHTLSSHIDDTANADIIARDMLYHAPAGKEFQKSVGSVKEGRNVDLLQYPESVYTADAEGEPEEGAIVVDGIIDTSLRSSIKAFRNRATDAKRTTSSSVASLTQDREDYFIHPSPSNSPFNDASSEFNESALFTPAPQGRSARSLFTPSPGLAPRKGQLFPYVNVPHFPKGLTRKDYVRMVRKKKRPHMDVRIYRSVGEALQTSLSHNADMGMQERSGRPVKIKQRHPPATDSTSPYRNASGQFGKPVKAYLKSAVVKNFPVDGTIARMKSINAIAGPSSDPLSATHVRTQGSHGSAHGKHQRADDDAFVVPTPPRKKSKPTKSSAESPPGRIPKHAQTQEPLRDTNYKPDTDYLWIHIHQISPVPSPVHVHNVRFIRAQLRNQNDDFSRNFNDIGVVKTDECHDLSWFPWPHPKLGYHNQIQDELSLGGHWNIWEDETQDTVKPRTTDNPHVLQTLKPVAHASLSPELPVIEISPIVTPATPASVPNLTSPLFSLGKPKHRSRRPSSSVPESDPENSDSSDPTNDLRSDRSEHSPKPSAKALGKRRAVSEAPESQIEPLPLSLSRSPPPALEANLHDSPRNNEDDMTLYLHALGPVHPQLDNYLVQTSPTAFQSPERPLRGSNALLSLSVSSSQPYISGKHHDSMGVDVFSEQRSPSLLPGLPMLPEYDPGVMNSWAMSGSSASNTPDPLNSYGNGTIDPSLLGGNIFAEDEPIVAPSPSPSPPPLSSHPRQGFKDSSYAPLHSPSYQDPPLGPQSPLASNSYSSYEPSQDSLFPSPSPSPRHSPTSDYSHDPTSRLSQIFTRPRRDARRIHPDMTAIEDLDLSLSGSSDEGRSTKKKHPAKKPAQAPSKRSGGRKRMEEIWPLDEVDSYCHQCRHKSLVMKLTCEDCTKKFCVRCLTTRYGERPESYDPLADFMCPFCDDACTCDVCTRKRGGTYNRIKSVRKASGSQGPRTSPNLGKARPHQPQPDVPHKATAISGPIMYWAAMYDLTGQKIGTAFVSGDGKEDVVMVRRRESLLRRRVFVGAVQPSWGLGKSPIVRDLEPLVSRNPESSGKRLREYVGNRAILSFPVAASVRVDPAFVEGDGTSKFPMVSISDTDDEGAEDTLSSPLSSLSSLNESDNEGGEGECRKWLVVDESDFGIAVQGGLDRFLEKGPGVGFSSDSLEDLDVVRAITLALRACGVAVQV